MQNGIHGSRSNSKDPISKWNSICNKDDTISPIQIFKKNSQFAINIIILTQNKKQICKKTAWQFSGLSLGGIDKTLIKLNRAFDSSEVILLSIFLGLIWLG
jgi:hypothetical protein